LDRGDAPKRNHDLHIIGGFTFERPPGAEAGKCVLKHNRYVQGTYSSILSNGRQGFQWSVTPELFFLPITVSGSS
jgi:hypothetical protein